MALAAEPLLIPPAGPINSWEQIERAAEKSGYPVCRRAQELLRVSEHPGKHAEALISPPSFLLWRDTYGWCPFSHQAQLHLEEKGVAYSVKKVPLTLYRLGERDPELLHDSPDGLVPTLRILAAGHKDSPGVGSVVRGAADVSAFIEAHCSGPLLLVHPGINHCLATAYLSLAEHLEHQVHEFVKTLASAASDLSSSEKSDAARQSERFLLATLEDVSLALSEGGDGGPYFFGAIFSVVDIAFAPWIDRAAALLSWLQGVQVRNGPFPAVDAWLAAMSRRPAHRELRLDDDTIVRIAIASMPELLAHVSGNVSSALAAAREDEQSEPQGEKEKQHLVAEVFCAEAAQALVACRSGAAALAAQRVPRLPSQCIDKLLRVVAAATLAGCSGCSAAGPSMPQELCSLGEEAAGDFALRSRLAVPRDMSAPAARRLRASFEAAAVGLVGQDRTKALLLKELPAYAEKIQFQSVL
ncbi:unnamed protein product [Polarella glacialis]|uniref:GST N-terminal domain-containing protein n=1 Tax=Polarella glacialis TaxID=89957 RepID=A0A813GQF3_POLGL|nr:unnamed protein product [Polarella glacialis]